MICLICRILQVATQKGCSLKLSSGQLWMTGENEEMKKHVKSIVVMTMIIQ